MRLLISVFMQAAEDALWTATERQQLLTLALTDAQKLISRSKKASSSSATVGFAAMAAMAAAAGVALLLSSRR